MIGLTKTAVSVNAGVHTSVGIEFQKHCALYLLFSKYKELKEKQYFICIEHHDDVLFCHLSNENKVTEIEAFQAKKSSDKWGLTADFFEILSKLCQTGFLLNKDSIIKCENYFHSLQFITNNTISLKIPKKDPTGAVKALINETNLSIKFNDLPIAIRQIITSKIRELFQPDTAPIAELVSLSLAFIDLGKTAKSQKEQLIGKFISEINSDIADPTAAVDALLKLFREIENTFNDGNRVKLLDNTKRVDSKKINDAIGIITTKQKAYEFYRTQGGRIFEKFNVTIAHQRFFLQSIINSFDLFKDLSQTEHRKILYFVKNNINIFNDYVNEVDCINALHVKFLNENNSQLSDNDIKSAIVSAYIETREEIWQ